MARHHPCRRRRRHRRHGQRHGRGGLRRHRLRRRRGGQRGGSGAGDGAGGGVRNTGAGGGGATGCGTATAGAGAGAGGGFSAGLGAGGVLGWGAGAGVGCVKTNGTERSSGTGGCVTVRDTSSARPATADACTRTEMVTRGRRRVAVERAATREPAAPAPIGVPSATSAKRTHLGRAARPDRGPSSGAPNRADGTRTGADGARVTRISATLGAVRMSDACWFLVSAAPPSRTATWFGGRMRRAGPGSQASRLTAAPSRRYRRRPAARNVPCPPTPPTARSSAPSTAPTPCAPCSTRPPTSSACWTWRPRSPGCRPISA